MNVGSSEGLMVYSSTVPSFRSEQQATTCCQNARWLVMRPSSANVITSIASITNVVPPMFGRISRPNSSASSNARSSGIRRGVIEARARCSRIWSPRSISKFPPRRRRAAGRTGTGRRRRVDMHTGAQVHGADDGADASTGGGMRGRGGHHGAEAGEGSGEEQSPLLADSHS